MPTRHAGSYPGVRAFALAQVLLLVAALVVPAGALAAIDTVSPDNLDQGLSATVTLTGPGNNFPQSGQPYAMSFSGTGVTATNVTRHSATVLSATVTVAPGATPGARTLTVTGAGGFSAQSATFTVNVAKVNTTTTITSDTPDPSSIGQAVSVGVSVAAVSGSTTPGGTVTVSDGTDTSAPCALSGSGGTATATCSLTPTTSGAKTLTATYGGDASFNGSTGTTGHTVIAAQATLVLTGTSSPAAYHDTQSLGTTGGSGTGAVTYSTGASTACSVAGTTLTITAATGTCSVTATKAADADYAEATSAAVDITVGRAGLVVTPDPQSRTFGQAAPTYTFAVTGFRNGETAGTAAGYVAPSCTSAYTSSTPVASSPLTITCSGGSATNYTFDTTATAQLTIGRADAVCTISGTTVAYDGDAHGATGTCTGVGGATLSGLDLGASFTDVPGGTADWSLGNANYNPASGSVAIMVNQAPQAIVFPPLPDMKLGAPSFALAATTGLGLPITYTSLTPGVCTVTGTTMKIVGVGTCTVVASQAGDENVAAAQSVTRTFTVASSTVPTPETSTASPLTGMAADGALPRTLLLGLITAGILGTTIVLLGIRARDTRVPTRRAGR